MKLSFFLSVSICMWQGYALTKAECRFYNENTAEYFVNSMPQVPFDLGELYSGLIPIQASNNNNRSLFFIFQPTTAAVPVDEITIWLNGGPGCSSLEGFFQENGRFIWPPGSFAPYENPYSWVNLTNMLWVEQPVGTGYTTGTPTATSQEETAADFLGFFKNFEQIFGIKNFKIYVTGESYAGRYVPYISAAMLDANDTTYFNLSGALMYDPCIGQFSYVQEQVPIVPFVGANNNIFNFNASFLAQLESLHELCGYKDYMEQYLRFPPAPTLQPPALSPLLATTRCDLFDLVNQAAFVPNPCFNVYQIAQMCPLLWDVLSIPTELVTTPAGADTYFNRADVKQALHAPLGSIWTECSTQPVYVGGSQGPEAEGDLSADPIQRVLPQVIEATQRVLVSNGNYDMIILTNGTLLAIQNMTWGGSTGFQAVPSALIDIVLPDLLYGQVFMDNGVAGWDGPGQGVMGIQHFERGLMWAQTYQSGHMQPQYQPRVTYRHLQWLLGHIETL